MAHGARRTIRTGAQRDELAERHEVTLAVAPARRRAERDHAVEVFAPDRRHTPADLPARRRPLPWRAPPLVQGSRAGRPASTHRQRRLRQYHEPASLAPHQAQIVSRVARTWSSRHFISCGMLPWSRLTLIGSPTGCVHSIALEHAPPLQSSANAAIHASAAPAPAQLQARYKNPATEPPPASHHRRPAPGAKPASGLAGACE